MVFSFASLAPAPAPAGFLERAAQLGIEFEADDLRKLGLYVSALLAGNQTVNLTAVRDADAAWDRHVLDSLTLLSVLADLPKGARVLDVGSGGGLPGLPLATCMPHLQFTLLEATGKKVDFLRATVAALQLRNVEVVQARAEALAHDRGERTNTTAGKVARANARRESYDAVVARAVGRLCTLLELVVPFAKISGIIALTKGAKAQEELDEAKEALHQLKAVAGPLIPTLTSTIVIIEKPSATPKLFPRADGEPARSPLGVKSSRDAVASSASPGGVLAKPGAHKKPQGGKPGASVRGSAPRGTQSRGTGAAGGSSGGRGAGRTDAGVPSARPSSRRDGKPGGFGRSPRR